MSASERVPRAAKTPRAMERECLAALAPIAPADAAGLLKRVLARVREEASAFTTVRADAAGWQAVMPGVELKLLQRDDTVYSFLLRLAPNARVPAHAHDADEECLVLEGEGYVGDIFLRRGDYHLARRGSRHGAIRTEAGAVIFLRGPCPLLEYIATGRI